MLLYHGGDLIQALFGLLSIGSDYNNPMEKDDSSNPIRISAVIPAYNCELYIARAIESVLSQTCSVDEIIIIDDGSADNTAEVVKRYGETIHYIHQQNAGASAARNTGIQSATGNWIAFLDADDEWIPERVQLQVQLLERNPELAWVSGNYIRCLCDENIARPHLAESAARNALGDKDYFQNFFAAYAKSAWGCTDTMLIKKSVLEEAGSFQIGQHQMEDIDLWWKIAQKYPQMGYITKPISTYHLGVTGSLIQSRTDYAACRQMIARHLAASKNTAFHDDITMCSVHMLKRWMRSMLFKKQKDDIHTTLDEFSGLFSPVYRIMMRTLTISPALTAWCLRRISSVVRCLKLRQQLTRKPVKATG